jgi:acyl carrier protein phosphodiesterase
MTMLIGRSFLNWYRGDVNYSTELINSFVKGVEKQAAESIGRYEQGKQTSIIEDVVGEGEETYPRAVETHQGLDSETWDLATIFKEHFPSLQRRSAFLTVWGYFEHELDKLCSLYRSEKGLGLALSDLKGSGIDRSTSYLQKVVGLNVQKTSEEWDRIKKLRRVRNVIVHQGGRLRDSEGKPLEDVIGYISEMEFLRGNDEIIIEEGFLSSVVQTCWNYFRLIGEAIAAREEKLKRESGQSK